MAKTTKIDVQEYVKANGYPTKEFFKEEKDLKKFYKKLTDEQLLEWVAKEGLEVTHSDNPSIYRMRLCVAILYKFFPRETKGEPKQPSKYAKYSDKALMEMAIEHQVPVEPCDNVGIMRMRLILALRASKVIE